MTKGFFSWNKIEIFWDHIGKVESLHNRALKKCDDLMTLVQSIGVVFHKQIDIIKNEYRIRLHASIDVCSYLLNGVLPFRGYD